MTAVNPDHRPYADAAWAYKKAGWDGVIPVVGKGPPKDGWTGQRGGWPSGADIQDWCDTERYAGQNIALRLPPSVLGVDVDNYEGHRGAATLAEREAEWGPLPDTWRSTSRTDTLSGIRLYRIPEGLAWPGQLPGGGVELIRWDHRYCVCWPSQHPTTGRTYRWTRGDLTTLEIPSPSELPALPQAWVDGLVRGVYMAEAKARLGFGEAARWVDNLPGSNDAPCRRLSWLGDKLRSALRNAPESRHETALTGVLDIVRQGADGHPGLVRVLASVASMFTDLITADGSRVSDAAWGEWHRLLEGAVQIVVAQPGDPVGWDPCIVISDPPFNPSVESFAEWTAKHRPVTSSVPDGRQMQAQDALSSPESNEQAAPVVSTWAELADVKAALAGQLSVAPPVELMRADGQHVFYAGKVNGLLGPSESGKTWVALLAAAQAVTEGRNVLVMDFEDTVIGMVSRLRSLGVPDELVARHVNYLAPSEPLERAAADLHAMLARVKPDLIILDGVNAAMTTMNLDLVNNKDATMFHLSLLLPLSRTGATVIIIDHTPKNDMEGASKGGIGAQAKRAAMTGAAIRVEVVKQFSRGHTGILKLWVDKDRGGHVRMASLNGKLVGLVHLEPGQDGALSVRFEQEVESETESGGFRPTALMGRVAEHLENNPGASQRDILAAHLGKDKYVRQAIDLLVSEGYVSRASGPRNATLHSLIRVWPSAGPQSGAALGRTTSSASVARVMTESYPPGHGGTQRPQSEIQDQFSFTPDHPDDE